MERILETPHPYTSSGEAAPVLSWQDEIFHEGATYIAVHFDRFHLAEGDSVILRSPDGSQEWAYTGLGKGDRGRSPGGFFAVHIKGDRVLIELHTAGFESAYGFKIDSYGRGFNSAEIDAFWEAGLGEKMNLPDPNTVSRSLCTVDDTLEAKCYAGTEPAAYDRSRAVARLLVNGAFYCTGWLVGCEGHVMTSESCVGSQSALDNTDFEFMAEGADCATDCRFAAACPGTVEASGGALVQVSVQEDYALIAPDTSVGSGTDLNAVYGYLQLRTSGAVLLERLYIPQHPAGSGKRIAMESTFPLDYGDGKAHVWSITEDACSVGASDLDVGYWADTQGGSGGSPVLAYSDHRVIALNHCRGSGFCATGNSPPDDPNRGVPIQSIIAGLGANVPNCAVCDPPSAPDSVSAVANGDNRIDVSWAAVAGATSYNIYREIAESCPSTAGELVANVAGTAWSDLTVSGGTTYVYTVTTVDDATTCESPNGTCDTATPTGLCTREPDFAGLETLVNDGGVSCSATLDWGTAVGHCGDQLVYNVYRSMTSGFEPGPENLLAGCLSGTSHQDLTIPFGVEQYFLVQAEDNSGNGAGSCANGNQTDNVAELSVVATGPDIEQFSDDLEGGASGWTVSAGPADSGTQSWAIVTTDSNSPVSSWFVADEAAVKDQRLSIASGLVLPDNPAILEFWHRHETELDWDGGVLEYSADGGTTWLDMLDGNPNRFLAGGYTGILNSSSNPLGGRASWSGDNGSWELVQIDLGDIAGQTILFRWRLGCDSSISGEGWWIDDVRVFHRSACECEALTDVSGQTITNTRSFMACTTLRAENFQVLGPGGNVTFVAGEWIELGNGFRVDTDASFTARLD